MPRLVTYILIGAATVLAVFYLALILFLAYSADSALLTFQLGAYMANELPTRNIVTDYNYDEKPPSGVCFICR